MIQLAEQGTNIFRKKALERISSPEQLTDYLKVTNPGIWALLAAVIVLLAGLFVWSMMGELETLTDGVAVVEGGTAQVTLIDSRTELEADMTVRFDDREYLITDVSENERGMSVAYLPVTEANGVYEVKVVTERIHPIRFLLG